MFQFQIRRVSSIRTNKGRTRRRKCHHVEQGADESSLRKDEGEEDERWRMAIVAEAVLQVGSGIQLPWIRRQARGDGRGGNGDETLRKCPELEWSLLGDVAWAPGLPLLGKSWGRGWTSKNILNIMTQAQAWSSNR
jgi:hypothetical protein